MAREAVGYVVGDGGREEDWCLGDYGDEGAEGRCVEGADVMTADREGWGI